MKLLFLAFILSTSQVLQAGEDLLLPLKRSSPLPLPVGSTLHLSDSSVLKIREYKGLILGTGTKEGQTYLRHNKKTFMVYVLEENKIKTYHSLKQKIKTLMGLEIEICELDICLTGELLTFKDYLELIEYSQKNNLKWILKVKMRDSVQVDIKNYVSQKFLENALPDFNFHLSPIFEIKVSQANIHHKNNLQNIFQNFGFKITEDTSALGIHPIVDLKVEIVEIKKTAFSKIGVDLPSHYTASVIPKGKVEMVPFDIALNALEQKGEAHIIASPRLSCRSGEQAHFLAGGEFPIKIMNYKTNDIQWKKHGILLNFKPLADLSGRVSLHLTAEVSLLDASQTVDGVPGLLVNRVESAVDMKSNQTLSLSGLIKKIKGQSKQGLYALSQIPLIGLLFGSENYRNDQSDLVIFITPQIL